MRRPVLIVAFFSLAAVALGLYRLENQVLEMERRLAETNAELLREQQAIQVLSAEWAYLNGPERLQGLADRHLTLAPVLPGQIASLDDLPLSPNPDSPAARRADRGPKKGQKGLSL